MQQDETDQSENTWLSPSEEPVQSLQPLRLQNNEAADAFFDFDLEPESPGSPIDECEYTRLIETTTVTPNEPASQAQQETESGYVCASPCSSLPGSDASQTSSHNNSSDLPYYDPESSDTSATFYDCIESRKDFMKLHNTSPESPTAKLPEDESASPTKSSYIPNGHICAIILDSDTSCSESLPQSQSTDSNLTYTQFSSTSASNNTLQDESIPELQTDEKKVETDLNDNVTCKKGEPCKVVNGEFEEIACEHINEPTTLECKVIVDTIKTPEKNDMEIPKREKGRLASITETDEEEEDEKPQRLRRCSSLKSGKTPPGTPGRKKIVRFADVLGLDLADVKTFLDNDLPKIPKSAYEDLDYKEDVIRQQNPVLQSVNKILVPLFQQPGGLPNFLDRVRENQVCLENCAVTDPITLTIAGSVRVRNLDFHKSVYIRYTMDSWKSFSDLQANYVVNSCDGFSDKFTFTMFGNALQIGQRIEIAIRFHCRGQQFWDSNHDSNYCFQCLPVNQEPKLNQVKPVFVPSQNECSGAFY